MNEFNLLPKTLEEDISVASYLNKNKNRYTNVLTIDKTRVKLQNLINDYINANYINFNYIDRFIATQAPLSNTVRDFWKMVWDQNSSCIVMLSSLSKEKADKYWSDNLLKYEQNETLDDKEIIIKVELIKEEDLKIWTLRKFNLEYNNEARQVYHLQYIKWEDHKEPLNPEHINTLIDQMFEYSKGEKCIVHCSAGVGRTGTFIACALIKLGNRNVFEIVSELRKQRYKMVQTEDQYKFIYSYLKYLNEFRQTGSSDII